MAQELNAVELLRKSLEVKVKDAVTEKFVREAIKEHEIKLRERIRQVVEDISFKHIGAHRDLLKMRDELHVFLHWENEK